MPLRLAVNGFGRIGRSVLRAWVERGLHDALPLVAINELADCATMAYLARYDSTHGRFPGTVAQPAADQLLIDGHPIAVSHGADPAQLPWADHGIDLVLECTGAFSDRTTAEGHLASGARRVLFSQPAQADVDLTVVYGVNHAAIDPAHTVLSAASCTTNGIVPVIQALDAAFGIDSGVITTIHSAMNDQPVLDAYHNTDLRKTRAAMNNITPVDTGLAKGIARILPAMAERFEAQALRVPVHNVSCMDLSVQLRQPATAAGVNTALRAASEQLPLVLGYTEEPLASSDFIHDPHSGVVDASQTRVAGGHLAKVLVWFDNEWAFANRLLDIALWLSGDIATPVPERAPEPV